MKPTTDLFDLIKSLTPNEKGYFKKHLQFFGKAREKGYLKLFDAIDKQEVYDEEALLKKFRRETFVKQFSVAKNYLYNTILKCLRSTHEQDRLESKAHAHLQNIHLLISKGRSALAAKELDKIYKLLTANENLVLWQTAYQRSRYITGLLMTPDAKGSILSSIDKEQELLEQQKHLLNIQKLNYLLIFKNLEKSSIRSKEEREELLKLKNSDLFESAKKLKGFEAELQIGVFGFRLHFLLDEPREALEYQLKAIEAWDRNPHEKKNRCRRYILGISNVLQMAEILRDTDLIEEYLQRLKQLETEYEADETTRLGIYSQYKMELLLQRGEYETLEKACDDLFKYYQERINPQEAHHKYLNYSTLSVSYFVLGRYEQALEVIDALLDTEKFPAMNNFRASARLMQLAIHLEMSHDEMLEYVVLSASRYIKSREFDYEFEMMFLKYFVKLAKTFDSRERLELYQEMKASLEHLAEASPNEKAGLANFNFLAWLDAKTSGRPLKEVYHPYQRH